MKFRHSTEKEIIQTTVNPMHVIEWPQISNTPIDEFHTEGYFTMAVYFLQAVVIIQVHAKDISHLVITLNT